MYKAMIISGHNLWNIDKILRPEGTLHSGGQGHSCEGGFLSPKIWETPGWMTTLRKKHTADGKERGLKGGICICYTSNARQHQDLFTGPEASKHILDTALLLNIRCLQIRKYMSKIPVGNVSGQD